MPKIKSLYDQMMIVPPVLARVMALKGGKGRRQQLRTIQSIVEESGLKLRTVQRLVWRSDWNGVAADVASKYLTGCRVDILHRTQLYEFIRKSADLGFPQLTDARMRGRFYKSMGFEE